MANQFVSRVNDRGRCKIFGNQTIQDLERNDYISSLRNKLLAEAFYLTGDIEKYGTGFIRILFLNKGISLRLSCAIPLRRPLKRPLKKNL